MREALWSEAACGRFLMQDLKFKQLWFRSFWLKLLFLLPAIAILAAGCQREQETSREEAEIKSNAAAYAKAFNQRNADEIASLWASDGIYVNPSTGETYKGRDEIRNYYQQHFTQKTVPQLDMTIDFIDFKEAGHALERGHFTVQYKDRPPVKGIFVSELVQENGKWLLKEVKEVDFEPAPSNYEHLKDLGWLVGEWRDHNDNVDVISNWKWDKNKNFLTQHFIVKMLNYEQIEGRQIVGWDPIENKIRSWIFDTDGGYGSGDWSQQGDSWYASTLFILPDGSKGSATHIYTKLNDNEYSFSSVSRDVNGQVKPNVGPFKFLRKE